MNEILEGTVTDLEDDGAEMSGEVARNKTEMVKEMVTSMWENAMAEKRIYLKDTQEKAEQGLTMKLRKSSELGLKEAIEVIFLDS